MKRFSAMLVAAAVCIGCSRSAPTPLAVDNRDLLRAREAVWRAWFAADEQMLHLLVPPDAVVLSSSEKSWQSQSDVLRNAQEFRANGGKLISLHFPRTVVQHFGNAAFIYSDYVMEVSEKGKPMTVRGRATEVFAWRGGRWVNPGWHTDSQ